MSFENRFKELRKNNKLSQEEVAQKLNVSQRVYSNYERGEREPSIEVLKLIADIYETSIDDILCHEKGKLKELSDDETNLIRQYRQLTSGNKRAVEALIDNLLNVHDEKEKTSININQVNITNK